MVTAKWNEAANICAIELRPADSESFPRFTAGAHIDVVTPSGATRQYSLCNPPREKDRYEIGVLRAQDSRGGSESMHESLSLGAVLEISLPRNHFPLHPGTHKSVLVAGGIGITPHLSMAEQLCDDGAQFELHYASKAGDNAAFRGRLLQERFRGRAFFYSSSTSAGRLQLDALFRAHSSSAHFYVCGPAGLIEGARAAAQAAGVAPDRLHHEHFAPPAGLPATAGCFEIQLARSALRVTVSADESIVQALKRVGVHVETSCEQGVCGTCMTPLLDGVAEHLDHYLSDDEQRAGKFIIPCCSRSKTPRLVLDL
jgi:vanillate O-demethylase ferredoxin subunit